MAVSGNNVMMRGFSKLPYDTLYYAACTNFFVACVEGIGGDIQSIKYIDIPNAIVVAIHYTA